ncbi:hypothetical protein MKW98_019956 [Papaver atlanticum]|uniref:Uncharacterized protein n=1 Tax=Papaver atlanticum TaxID=357466 RepID=A0AAD4X7C8_9MAGN|nr:hypothetical protein MKW98_019956 [Papaver atlanticum]
MASRNDDDKPVTIEELRSFHRIDRDTYRMLAINLGKDPLLSMAVIALWIFMEELGYPSIILELLIYQNHLLTSWAFDEAVSSVYYIITSTPPPPLQGTSITDMPITLRVLQDYGSPMYISMNSLFEHAVSGYTSLKQTIGTVCYRLFADIFREATLRNLNLNLGYGGDEIYGDANTHDQEETDVTGNVVVEPEPIERNSVVFGNGIPPALLRGETNEFKKLEVGSSSGTKQSENISEIGESSSSLPTIEEQQIVQVIPPDERTMFVTFSRGFPISEGQLREFFVR